MSRLGRLGSPQTRQTSGIYSPQDNLNRQEQIRRGAESYISSGKTNTITNAGSAFSVHFSPDGLTAFFATPGNRTTAKLTQYSLSSPFDVSTLSYQKQLIVGDYNAGVRGVTMTADGVHMYISGNSPQVAFHATLGTPHDINTAVFDCKAYFHGTNAPDTWEMRIGDSGTKMYLLNVATDTIQQYTLSAAWDISTASYASKSFSVMTQETVPYGFHLKPDGTKLYVVGHTNDTIYQYSLSVAWDISTASYDAVSFSVSAQDTTPSGLFFKDDGTAMYVVGNAGSDINEYSLSTAWDISSASYVRVTSNLFGNFSSIYFKNDGTKMYVSDQAGVGGGKIREYNLATAWNLSSISLVNTLNVGRLAEWLKAFYINDDGTTVYVTFESGNDIMYSFPLATAWDISSAYGFLSYLTTADGFNNDLTVSPDESALFYSDSFRIIRFDISSNVSLSPFWATGTTWTASSRGPLGFAFFDNGRKIMIGDNYSRGLFSVSLQSAYSLASVTQDASVTAGQQRNVNAGVDIHGVYVSPDNNTVIALLNANPRCRSYVLSSS